MSTLYIRPPSRGSLDGSDGAMPACRFALAGDGGSVMQQGADTLASLGPLIAQAARVVLLLAPADVSLLRVKSPPLTGARLKAALPNLVEDQLISDPSECVVVAASSVAAAHAQGDGLLRVAVVERAWLALLVQALQAQGARAISALPAQLCLPLAPDTVYAAVGEAGVRGEVELALRLARHDGVGLALAAGGPDAEAAALQTLHSVRALAGTGALHVFVPSAQLAAFQRVCDSGAAGVGVTVAAEQWSAWLPGAAEQTLDLAAGLDLKGAGGPDWRRWRWPLTLAALVALINIGALNADWWRLKREADTQQAKSLQIYKNAFPNETVVRDPLRQMRQKLAQARADSGQLAPDDFLSLAAAFSQAWNAMPGHASVAGLDYRDRALLVRLKNDGELPFDAMKAALAARKLNLSQQPGGAWQVRSEK